jgi:hypothetical protein
MWPGILQRDNAPGDPSKGHVEGGGLGESNILEKTLIESN